MGDERVYPVYVYISEIAFEISKTLDILKAWQQKRLVERISFN